jgi:hypothetical protein
MASVFQPLIIPGKFAQVPALFKPGQSSRIHTYDTDLHDVLPYLAQIGTPGQKALLISGRWSTIYPILQYSKYRWTVAGADNLMVQLDGRSYNTHSCTEFIQAGSQFDLVMIQGLDPMKVLACRPPWKLMMRTHTESSGWTSIYDPHIPAAPPAP